ncbi:hypothetical protein [Sorangium atrum]|uniref:Flavodoxin-like domain-containing protein n=1 Tax=Sorangium atrum TaxID=2995308 RepID=A0ABT5BQQ8_9BACT|nr:hypothetical protein [Sorangium aterium]MDC0676490.1 hypothetical protein [Sorangium aterium]
MQGYTVGAPPELLRVFRVLSLITAIANAGGNVLLLLFHRPIFALLGVPPPIDVPSFAFVSGFSFTIGVLAFLIFRATQVSTDLLVTGIVAKSIYSLFTFYFYTIGELHWLYRFFGIWDGVFALIFFFFLIYLVSPDLNVLNAGAILPGAERARGRSALLLYYSLTGNGQVAMQHVKEGLLRKGYAVDEKVVEAEEPLFRFPLSWRRFWRITFRAVFRRPAAIKPLGIPADHAYDLIVVECQTWFIGMAAPMEAVFEEPANRAIFRGRDVATVHVCRGLWRRTQAMTIRWLNRCDAHVVGARAYSNPGWEPARLFSLFIFLGTARECYPRWLCGWFLQRQRLSEDKLARLVRFGEALGERPCPGEPATLTGEVSG